VSVSVRVAPGEADAVVVGSGPNGLAAAITLAQAGHSVAVFEAADSIGGGVRSAELTLPGFVHDVCSAIHPFGRVSPFFRDLDLERDGLRWVTPDAPIGHPLDDGPAVLLERDVATTARGLGTDRDAYRWLFDPLVDWADGLFADLLAPFHVPLWPPSAAKMAWFGLYGLQPAAWVARRFKGERARALFAGAAAHSILAFSEPISAAAGVLMLASAHADGWPFPAGGSGKLGEALGARLRSLGGAIETDRRIGSFYDLPKHRAALFDTAPRHVATVARDRLPESYRRRLVGYRYGPGIFKVDIAIDGAIPWRDEALQRAGTVHVGGTYEEIAAGEAEVARGKAPERPFVLLAQQSVFDRTRAPDGKNTVWAYCHVPNGSTVDMTDAIVAQIERFAPGFKEHILKLVATGPADLERYNPNYVGGDIAAGRLDLGQLFTRPSLRLFDPYSTPDPAIFLCSAATPPGAGVHGMCGYHAAHSAMRQLS
jgi:phytoene dehydrogenase-like protein